MKISKESKLKEINNLIQQFQEQYPLECSECDNYTIELGCISCIHDFKELKIDFSQISKEEWEKRQLES